MDSIGYIKPVESPLNPSFRENRTTNTEKAAPSEKSALSQEPLLYTDEADIDLK